MAVDARIGSVETEMTAHDPDLANDPKFIARVVARVMEEMKNAEIEKTRREADRKPSRTRGR